ncbi:unnamed protein product [Paramecium sonneborni]|uniref:AAA+ ATPase domain-containing protein n=1 Tax=Paramecium sonneborni TaxID=65129 RepID=A0A8S1Q0P9_9CILI|nr:unnamed protein product [Paramecium sonneborni]
MLQESAKIKLASRLFDRGKQPQSNTNERPLTAKIAIRAQMNQTMTKIEKVSDKLPAIHEERSFSFQKSVGGGLNQIRGKSQNNNDTLLKNNKTFELTNDIFLDERRLLKSRQVHELMDRMIGRVKPPSPPKETQKIVQVLPSNILDNTRISIIRDIKTAPRKTIRTQQMRKEILNKTSISQVSDNSDESNEENNNFGLKDVDAFIQMIKEHKLSQQEFMYLIKRKKHSNDAYNMRIVNYPYIQKHQLNNFYTLSAKGLTRYENNITIEFVSLNTWLEERDQFNAIKSLSFFKKFRKWKTLKKWQKILHYQRTSIVQGQLCEKMLILNPIYQKLIVTHRSLCYDIESLRIVDIDKIEEELTDKKDQYLSLQEFSLLQQKQRNKLVEKILIQSKKMKENCISGLKTVIDKLRTQINQEKQSDDDHVPLKIEKTTAQSRQIDKKQQIIETFGFPERMDYGHRALMRTEFIKFLRLAYLLDFIAVQSLGQIYIKSATEFVDKLIKVQQCSRNNRKLPKLTEDEDEKRDIQEYDPIFTIELRFNPIDGDLDIERQQVPWDTLNENLLNFDLQECIRLKEEKVQVNEKVEKKSQNSQNQNQAMELQEDYLEDPEMVYKREVQNLYETQLEVYPSKRDFLSRIQEAFCDGLDQIQVIERWSKHPDFLQYVQALEEWDEIIGDKWTQPDSINLNPSYWIKEHPMNNIFMHEISLELDQAFEKLENFQKEFNEYLNLIWRQEKSEISQLQNPKLMFQSKIFACTLKSAQLIENILQQKLIPQVDIGLYRVKIQNIQNQLSARQSQILIQLEELYLQLFRNRAQLLKIWLIQSIKSLNIMVIRIEEFIEQKNSVDRITKELPQKREEIETAINIITLAQDCKLQSLKKEDKDLSQELNTLESSLNVALSDADNNTAKNIEKFKKTLKERIDKLKGECMDVSEAVSKDKFLTLNTDLEDAIKELSEIDAKTKQLEQSAQLYTQYEEILQSQEQAQYEVLENTREQLNLRLGMWQGIQDFRKLSQEWQQLQFTSINAKEIAQKTEGFVRIVQRCEKNLQENRVITYLKKIVWEFKDTIPVVTALRSQYLQQTHWQEIKQLVRQEFDINDQQFTLNKLLDMNVAQHNEMITEIAVKAAQEDSLNNQLKTLESQWNEVELKLKPYKDQLDVMVLGEVEELIQLFDEGLANMSNILASRYVRPLRQRAEKFQSDLLLLSDIIEKWVECQKKWMYLESIFCSQDIKKQLSNESQLFDSCDRLIKKIVKQVNLRPQIMRLLAMQNMLDNLTKTLETLEQIEKSLEDYLEVKRGSFPRFYFLSNDELLEILSKQTDINSVQSHLGQCFEALVKLYFGDQPNVIQGIHSIDGELIQYYKSIPARGNVETWLHLLELEMVETLRKLCKQGLQDYLNGMQKTKTDWILNHKSQIVAVVSQILWSINTEDAINESSVKANALYEWHDMMEMQLKQLTALVRGDLTVVQRKTIVSLITTDVHNRDIVLKLADNSIESTSDFQWQQQLRYYWDDEYDDCLVKQVTSLFHYGYEYLGPTSRLVITPLTDRCWITITSALTNQLGAAPAGPAGTGKTESTKDLAKCLGRYCIVFNCSDQITAATMNKLFSGLAQQGAWACLDEFNRIDIEVLSVIAQQLLTIRIAQLQQLNEFLFDGRHIQLKNTYGVFITMNPGYAGRTELPDNLKSLFRPVAMMIPDYRLIAEIMLFAEGFENANDLSSKMVQLYKLSSQQLSQQDHYDFGMRAVKSLLVMAGSLKRADTTIPEDIVLIKAMRDANIPKFLKDDIPLFMALIQDLFPKVEIANSPFEFLEQQLNKKCKQFKLQIIPAFTTKMLQLFDTQNVRFGTMIVGGSGSGKTNCYQILAETISEIKVQNLSQDQRFQELQYVILNPKSISMGELYGEVDPFTNEWQDGLASSIIRECNNSKERHWIVFDGPVDALWIENMNSVLDDSMTLCLANSERIKLRHELRMLFEVQDLSVASPATVSRCGMVYMTVEDVNWYNYVECWIEETFSDQKKGQIQCCNQMKEKSKKSLQIELKYLDLIRNLFKTQYKFLADKLKHFEEPFITIEIQRVKSVCNIFTYFLKSILVQKSTELPKQITAVFAYSCIWGLCSSFDQKFYEKMGQGNQMKRCQFKLCLIIVGNILQSYSHLYIYIYYLFYQLQFQIATYVKDQFQSLLYPKGDTIFDFYVDQNDFTTLLSWESQLQEFQFVKDQSFFSIVVQTVDTLKFQYIMQLLIREQTPTLITGQTGVGKSMLAQSLLFEMKLNESVQPVLLNFSAQTKSKQTQLAIESKLIKKGKILFGARVNESIAIFIDDINMPALEKYGAQPCIEFLRQMIELQGTFDRTKLFWKHIEDVTILIAGGPPGGGRNNLSQRFVRQFNVLNMPNQSDSILEMIYGSILKGYFNSINFSENVRKTSDQITRITVELFRRISQELLPIPAKFHYTFNSRDISKVFQGLLMIRPISCNSNNDTIAKLWVHECARVFCDRLISVQDKLWFYNIAIELLMRYFSVNKDDITNNILFSDILKLEAANVLYEEVTEKRKVIVKSLQDKLDDYIMTTNDKMELVFFDDALEHILRISRIFRQPRGNAMLIGVGGSGKQSLTKLASFLMRSEIFQIEIVKTYNADSFRADLIKILMKTGGERIPLTFIFNEAQIVQESFLEDINNILNTGEVPNLFSKKEDLEQVYNTIRPIAIKAKRLDSPESLWTFFVEGIRNSLHIVLCMSPVGNQLRIRCRKFPSLVNCCTIDWFTQWPKEALLEVANKFLDKIPNLKQKDQLAQMCMEVNLQVAELCDKYSRELRRQVYTTPKSYLDQIQLYANLLIEKQQEHGLIQRKLADGLDKLFKANETVAILKIEMQEIQPQLIEQSVKTEQFLKQLAIDQSEANLKERLVNDEAQIVNQQASEIKVIADEAQNELNKALPALKEAEEALQRINKNDIAEIKGFINPPPVVQLVLEAVCILLQEKTDWNSAKSVMISNDFTERLMKYDKTQITEQMLRKLRQITLKHEFDPIYVAQKSQACKSLCMWCRAIDSYSKIAKDVEPRKKKVADMQQKFEVKNKELTVKQNELQKVRDRVARLQKECDETVEKKNELEKELERTKKRLVAAEKLTYLLADEGIRWKDQIKLIEQVLQQIIGDVFLAASTVSYLGAFTGQYREQLIKDSLLKLKELDIPFSENYSLSTTLENQIVIRDWVICGLPNDAISIDNGVIVTRADRWPLMIDPQGQANKWLKQFNKELKVMRFTEQHFLKGLQQCISSGYEVLLEEVEEKLEPSIDSVLQKQIIEIEGRKLIKVGDQKVDYHNQFKLYFTTKIANPQYLPEVFIKTTVINFSITFEGLCDQLLGDVMKFEKPEIEKQRDEIIIKMSNANKQLKQAQDSILDLLANAQGMILDNEQLIHTLEVSKFQSSDIQKSLEETIIVEKQINESRNLYHSVALRGTILYFVISDMSLIDPMYQYSLQYFKKLYNISLNLTPKTDLLNDRLLYLEETITQTVFKDICRGLFQQHRKIFSFLICAQVQRQNGSISNAAWNLLLRDQIPSTPIINPDKIFLKDSQWNLILCIQEQITELIDLSSDIKNNILYWKEFTQIDDIYQASFPKQSPLAVCTTLNPFYRLLLIKALKPEKIMFGLTEYVVELFGEFYINLASSSMDEIYQSSESQTPIIFILSPGADPTQTLFKLAKEQQSQIDVISLGQGQGKKAENLIQKGQKDGTWVMLQNCHLARSWMPQLEKLMESLTSHHIEVHNNFRIFLTSMPAAYFPVSTLQNGLKLTTEPPRGLKSNLLRSYQEFQETDNQQKLFKQLFYSISFFHAIVQERRKFGPLGFNISYEFNDSDLDISIQMMKMFIAQEEEVPWDAMQFMIGQINYGGRVTDDQDRVCLTAILKKYLGDHIENNVKFSNSGIYYLPEDDYINYISQLPNQEDPEVFGMHENANIVFQTQESQKILDIILSIQPRVSSTSTQKSPDIIVMEKTIYFQSNLPEILDKNVCNQRHYQITENGSVQSLSTVLFQEIDKFNRLIELIQSTLIQLQQAIKGFVLISSELDEMYLAFLNNSIPPNWMKQSYSTLKPLSSWFKDLIARVNFIRSWMEKDFIPAYWMSGLFYPQGFLTGVLQTHSRKYKIPINKLNFKFKVLDIEQDRIRDEVKDGVYVYGLYLEGARWDYQHETLIEQQVGQIYFPLTMMFFQPMEEYQIGEEFYNCPCYKTSNRTGVLSTTGQSTNFILSIDLMTKTEKPEYWTLRGTAIISQLND